MHCPAQSKSELTRCAEFAYSPRNKLRNQAAAIASVAVAKSILVSPANCNTATIIRKIARKDLILKA